MFIFHGWADLPDPDPDTGLGGMDLSRLAAKLEEFRRPGLFEAHLATGLNSSLNALWVAGCRNRRHPSVLDLYQWLADESTTNYGLLYVNDGESAHENEFRIYRLCRGQVTEHADNLLSPIIPTVEDPYVPDRGDR